jgi:hypothetical protein
MQAPAGDLIETITVAAVAAIHNEAPSLTYDTDRLPGLTAELERARSEPESRDVLRAIRARVMSGPGTAA